MKEISIGEFARRSRLSLRALRLYDERGVLVPSRVDQASGYRYYDTAQLDEARLVVMLRELQLPLAAIRELPSCDPADAATRIAEHWRDAEAAHDARRALADYLVNQLRGKSVHGQRPRPGRAADGAAVDHDGPRLILHPASMPEGTPPAITNYDRPGGTRIVPAAAR